MTSRSRRVLLISLFALAGVGGLVASIFIHRQPTPPPYVEPTRTAHYPITFVSQLKDDPHAGKKIFQEYCATCHAKNSVIPVNAPRIGDKAAWAPFKKIGFEMLFKLAAEGYKAMPARGGCFECSDKQLKAAIRYMLKNSD